MSWDEVKKAREIWPPNIEKILLQYHKAEVIDPKYFIVYKDRARLFHVLGEHEQSKREYGKWLNLGIEWEDEVTKELELRKTELEYKKRFHKITPWEYLEKYLAGDTKVDPTTKGKRKNPKRKNPKREKSRANYSNKTHRKKSGKIIRIIQEPKKVFQTSTNDNKKMEQELIEKFGNNTYFKEIFPKLKNNLKKLSHKKISELIDEL